MSDEYSLHTRFLLGLDSAAEYERRLARLPSRQADLIPVVAWPPSRPPITPIDLVATDPAYRAIYERALAYYKDRAPVSPVELRTGG